MDIISTQKFIRMSPKKIRFVVTAIKKMTPQKAVEVLPYVNKRAATPLLKVIKSAIANAKNKGISQDKLEFKEIQVGEAPRLKRGRPASRGMWHPYKRRMSHIRVVLTTGKKEDKPETKEFKVQAKPTNDNSGNKKNNKPINEKRSLPTMFKRKKIKKGEGEKVEV